MYLQDADLYDYQNIEYESSKIQPNDILSITVSALVPETAIPYNVQTANTSGSPSLDIIKLQGYLVSKEGTIVFPVLGKIAVGGKSTAEIEKDIAQRLEDGGHLKEPTVSVRLLNAKVTILGEVKNPGTYTFTEQNITLPQALGYAGDLTINGQRNDVLLITEENGVRKVVHIDLTSADWFNSSHYFIKPNDFIVVNPNDAKVKSAGIIGDAGIVLTIVSIALTAAVLIVK
ncbi:polysaccharide biosynthesis/export family protein [Aequorivita todarodis]|uniref:polysaccharide biosynthesis/export family protein n=1 Tax=Aequorivita todarodis TaxID=2036821 RepID=UPI002350D92E|nr:polysaccharide biosynthesis/export family protein [Aequorivita todarodis]MDC8001206.1 polysaccharide biosynthesis/export family protein [Aequorivita todarodis]